MKFLWILSILAYNLVSCQRENSHHDTMNVINNYSEILGKEQGVILSMYGLHYAGSDKIYDGKIHTIALGYDTEKRMKYKEARKFFYAVVDGLLEHLNKNEKIRKNFFHCPLTYEDLEIHLSFDFENRKSLKCDEVESIHINENEIRYYIVNGDVGDTNELVSKEIYPSAGTLTFTGLDSTRRIVHKLPETEDK